MMKGGLRLLTRTLVSLLALSRLPGSAALFDSLWLDAERVSASDGGSFYGSDDAADANIVEEDLQEEVVSGLWQVFFPNSPPVFRSSLLNRGDVDDTNDGLGPSSEILDDAAERKYDGRSLLDNRHSLNDVKRANVNREKRQGKLQKKTQKIDIPSKYTVTVDLGEPNEEDLDELQRDLATFLGIPQSHVHTDTLKDGKLRLYFVKGSAPSDSTDQSQLIPSTQAAAALAASGLQASDDTAIRASGVSLREAAYMSPQDVLTEPYFAITLAAAAVGVMGLIIFLIYCCVRKRQTSDKQKQFPPTQDSALLSKTSPAPNVPVPHQICLYPAAKPAVNTATAIQPDAHADRVHTDVSRIHSDLSRALLAGRTRERTPFGTPSRSGSVTPSRGGSGSVTPCRGAGTPLSGSGTGSPVYSSGSQSGTPIPGTPVHTPPLRIKARGLLERRGSNASLTLELGPNNPDTCHMGSPPKESTVEEYLMAASHRMTRPQLRRCLDNVKAVYGEFWEIPMNHPDKNIVPGSGVKNRYRTIIPNEATRVILPERDSDILTTYINANHIRGFGGEVRGFIATQGPMSNTTSDFWQMVWQEKSPIIVMITKLKEKNKNKCENYVPDFHDTFGDIDVQVEEISEKEGYIIRKLRLRQQGTEHTLLHYWYTAWPDHKAPNTAAQLLTLVKEVELQRHDQATGRVKGPVIVHCSAGIGRTGCFIAASVGLQALREENAVDVQAIVCNMRLDRGGMVQTNEQYVFIHQTLILYEQELPEEPQSGD